MHCMLMKQNAFNMQIFSFFFYKYNINQTKNENTFMLNDLFNNLNTNYF